MQRAFRFSEVTDFVEDKAHIKSRFSSGGLEFNLYLARCSLGKARRDPQYRANSEYRGVSDAEIDHLAAHTN